MMIKSGCLRFHLSCNIGAILTNIRTHPGYQQDNSTTRVYQIQETPWFLPREYVKSFERHPSPRRMSP